MRKWIGIDVGGTTIKGAAVLEDGSIVAKGERATETEHGVSFVLDTIAQLARDMAKAADRGMVIGGVRLLAKSGGRSGDWQAGDADGSPSG